MKFGRKTFCANFQVAPGGDIKVVNSNMTRILKHVLMRNMLKITCIGIVQVKVKFKVVNSNIKHTMGWATFSEKVY